jgi:hypothetical protein
MTLSMNCKWRPWWGRAIMIVISELILSRRGIPKQRGSREEKLVRKGAGGI